MGDECQRLACGIALKEGNLLLNGREGIDQDSCRRIGGCIGTTTSNTASAAEA